MRFAVSAAGVAAAITLSACSSDDPAKPATVSPAPTTTSDASSSPPTPVTPDAGPAYAPSPYGVEVGDTIANLSFSGWSASPYTTAGTIRFSDFYDPTGTSARKLLVINVCSVWCMPCQSAYADFKAKAADYAAKGVALLSVLYENGDVKPISTDEAAAYATKNEVNIPIAVDPAYQLSNAVRPAEVPSYIVVSVRDMKVLGTLKSADSGPWAFVDQKLTEIK